MKSFKFSNRSFIQTGLWSIAVAILMSLTVAKPLFAAPVDDYFTAIKNDNDGVVVTLLFSIHRGVEVMNVPPVQVVRQLSFRVKNNKNKAFKVFQLKKRDSIYYF